MYAREKLIISDAIIYVLYFYIRPSKTSKFYSDFWKILILKNNMCKQYRQIHVLYL